MGMAARGHEVLEQAKAQLIQAKTVEQLRQAQAVVLPLSCGLSLEQTAALLGISVSWTCKLRTRFARGEIMVFRNTGGLHGISRAVKIRLAGFEAIFCDADVMHLGENRPTELYVRQRDTH